MVNVYVRLLGEGTEVFRPVPATMTSASTCILGGAEFYDPEDEQWEWLPGTLVKVEARNLEGAQVLVAIGECGMGSCSP